VIASELAWNPCVYIFGAKMKYNFIWYICFQVLPLENNMKNPQDFGGWTGVLNTGMVIVAALYTSVGFFGFLKYGEKVQGSITLNLPPDDM
jgi:Transmembrane amino acid transporter protein.